MAQPITLLYIAGTGRSGSTLLNNLLGQMPGFTAVGELFSIWDRGLLEGQLCGCGEPLPDCPLWSAVLNQAYGEREYPDPHAMHATTEAMLRARPLVQLHPRWPENAYRRRVDRYVDQMEPLYQALQAQSNSRVIVEASKLPTYAFGLARLPIIDLNVLHLVRDSRAVAHSWQRKRRRPEITDRDVYLKRFSPIKSTYHWLLWNGLSEALGRLKNVHYKRMRYEDFVMSPAESLREIEEFVGQPGRSWTLDDVLQLPRVVHTVSGNPMRFEKTLTIRPDVEWRTGMPHRQYHQVTLLSAPLLWRYGYFKRAPSEVDSAAQKSDEKTIDV